MNLVWCFCTSRLWGLSSDFIFFLMKDKWFTNCGRESGACLVQWPVSTKWVNQLKIQQNKINIFLKWRNNVFCAFFVLFCGVMGCFFLLLSLFCLHFFVVFGLLMLYISNEIRLNLQSDFLRHQQTSTRDLGSVPDRGLEKS